MVFQLLAPAVDWLDYLSSSLSPLELNDTEPVVLYAKEYLQQVSDLINKTDRRSETVRHDTLRRNEHLFFSFISLACHRLHGPGL